jgi:hypothetical protein
MEIDQVYEDSFGARWYCYGMIAGSTEQYSVPDNRSHIMGWRSGESAPSRPYVTKIRSIPPQYRTFNVKNFSTRLFEHSMIETGQMTKVEVPFTELQNMKKEYEATKERELNERLKQEKELELRRVQRDVAELQTQLARKRKELEALLS